MLKILLGYESADMHNEANFQAQLVEIQEIERGFEYLSEREKLDGLIVKIKVANELYTPRSRAQSSNSKT